MRLLLIRHGETASNVAGVISSIAPGAPLTERGITQASAAADALAGTPIDAVHASVLTRAQQTAAPLATARGLEVHVLDGIEEIAAGVWEDRDDRDALVGYVGPMRAWWHDRAARITGGESGAEFFGRFDRAVREVEASVPEGGTAAVFTHGAAIRVWCSGTAENLDEHSSAELDLQSTGMVVMEGSSAEGWWMREWHAEPLGTGRSADGSDPAGTAPISPR